MERKKKKISENEVKTTGHEWDGIKEYDNPDPLWLRYLFYITLFFALGYWFLYPSLPSQDNDGILSWSSSKEALLEEAEIKKIQNKYLPDFMKASYNEIFKQQSLLNFGINGGRSAFNNNCAMCHGVGGVGNPGYPNLSAGSWIWGGRPEDIEQTLLYGIRSGHDEARDSQMPSFGRDGTLTPAQIHLLVKHVNGLFKQEPQDEEAHNLFIEHCASCHGNDGGGNREVGAPALNRAIRLYGYSDEIVYDVIYNGRGGVMPYWTGRLSNETIKQLVVYVHQLGGGEKSDLPENKSK
jgi:cytochrome c oxidase cbb3-type subunit III